MTDRVRFAAQLNADPVGAVRELAESEGTQIDLAVEEALVDLLAKRSRSAVRSEVMAH